MKIINYILCAIAIFLILGMTITACVAIYDKVHNLDEDKERDVVKSYQSFQEDTDVINGTVKKAEKESNLILPDSFNLIVKTNEGSKMLSVTEQEYRDYQPENNVHLRIDKTNNNTIVRDLKNETDLDSLKEYKKYYKDSPARLFENVRGS
ncbi:hypothetical protein [Mammaliicoccus lentus]|uniref:hypothetical protein n=1 Tax=Mammaliicoccus lentus TaxID=42858 RepID=UPI003CF6D37F